MKASKWRKKYFVWKEIIRYKSGFNLHITSTHHLLELPGSGQMIQTNDGSTWLYENYKGDDKRAWGIKMMCCCIAGMSCIDYTDTEKVELMKVIAQVMFRSLISVVVDEKCVCCRLHTISIFSCTVSNVRRLED